jgi:hypothetical protein
LIKSQLLCQLSYRGNQLRNNRLRCFQFRCCIPALYPLSTKNNLTGIQKSRKTHDPNAAPLTGSGDRFVDSEPAAIRQHRRILLQSQSKRQDQEEARVNNRSVPTSPVLGV